MGINRSSLYYLNRSVDDTDICNRIYEVYLEYPYYGYRKICAVLGHQRVSINHKKVQRLMQQMGLKAIYPKPKTSVPDGRHSISTYLLKGLDIVRPNHVWAMDIAYLRLPTGMVYLFALIDWYSRFIVGWILANSMTTDFALEAFMSALKHGTPEICNTDQGSQFTRSLD